MATRMTYTALIAREGDMWLADVPRVPGAHAYARTLNRLRKEITDALILAADLDDDAAVDVRFEPGDITDRLLVRALDVAEQRRQLRRKEASVLKETSTLAKALISAGWSVRDAAGALDVTPGRISQLVNS